MKNTKPPSGSLFERNIGLITESQQQSLARAKVLICGVGGMGGICAEALARMGVGSLTLVDGDRFEYSNSNRQVFCNVDTVGEFKTEVLERELLRINPDLKVKALAEKVTQKNVGKILEDIDIVVNAMDDMKSSIILERRARSKKKTIVDAWLTPFASVFVMDENSPHWEEFLNLPSRHVEIDDLDEEVLTANLHKEVDYTLSHFDPYEYVDKALVSDVVSGRVKRPSFVLVTWFSGLLMANEVFKKIVGYETEDHRGIFFNQYKYSLIKGK
jgi:tRNA A37 threonylcarbamoyladenosine dehydratase